MGLVTLTFDLETGMRVASKVGNLSSKFGHARPLGSQISRYVRDGRTDRQKQPLLPPSLGGGGIINTHNNKYSYSWQIWVQFSSRVLSKSQVNMDNRMQNDNND